MFILLGLAALTAIFLIGGIIYENRASFADLTRYPPPGQLIEVNGKKWHLYCTGKGDTTVIMDYGLGGLSQLWGLIQPEIAPFAQVCTYDRPGYGWSQETDTPRTSQQMVEDLRNLLKEAGLSPPYLLVGHSLGGLNMRLFASQYPEEVMGLVLVDAVPANVYSRLSPQFAENMDSTRRLFQKLALISRFGLLRLAMQWGGLQVRPDFVQSLPLEQQDSVLSQFTAKTFKTAIAESQQLEISAAQVNQVPFPSDLPLIVLSQGKTMFSGLESQESGHIWPELQAEMAQLSKQGTLVIASESGHNIHLDQPELVIEAIKTLIAKFSLKFC